MEGLGFIQKRESYVRVTDDHMEAWVYLAKPDNDEGYTKEDILALLGRFGVVFGFMESNLSAMAKKKVYNREIKVAKGRKLEEGKNGEYEFFIDKGEVKKRPIIRADGSVDYSSMSVVEQIKRGDVIAIYHPAEHGKPGQDVEGKEVTAGQVKDLPILKGKGFYLDEQDANIYRAATDGKVEYKDGKLDVRAVLTIEGDVSHLTERIDFLGDVIINGNVQSGIVIRTTKSITISGTVEPVEMFAGGDIILKRGIQGADRAKIICRGNLYADFIEHTSVVVSGNVRANTILNSQIEAGGNIVATGKRGAIIGGDIHGTKGIEAVVFGNASEVRTSLHVGFTVKLAEEWNSLVKKEKIARDKLQILEDDYKQFNKIKQQKTIPEAAKQRIMTLTQNKLELEDMIQKIVEKKDTLIKERERGKGASIRSDGTIYRGTIICVDANIQAIERNTSYMEYYNDLGVLKSNVIIK